MRIPLLFLLLVAPVPLVAQDQETGPFGFNTLVCPANSDTIVGVPLRPNGSRQATLGAAPAVNGDAATLSIAGTPAYAVNGFVPTWYVKFSSGSKNGRFYTITANDASTLTIKLDGDDLAGVLAGDNILIAQYWTLDSLFPPAGATTAWTGTAPDAVPNGHAIVASTSTLAGGRRTEILLSDTMGAGTNLTSPAKYYIHGGMWKLNNGGGTNRGPTTILYPDTYFRIRHPVAVTLPTKYRAQGEVEMGSFTIPLSTLATGQGKQDNYVCIPRPVDKTLDGLNLRQSGAFVASTSTLAGGRRDELLVFDNTTALINKSASATYYVHNGIWKLNNGGSSDRGSVVIPAGAGFIVRKYETATGASVFWSNTAGY